MEKKYNCGIYQIRNLVNGKIYIGQSTNLSHRKSSHFSKLRKDQHDNEHLQNAYNLYGKDNFIFEIIMYCESFELTRYEDAIKTINKDNCYNIRIVADSNKGWHHSEKTKKQMSISASNRSEESNKNISESLMGEKNGFYGKHHSEETKQLFSEQRLGTSHSWGMVMSDESKHKMSVSHLGKKASEETKLKQSKLRKGKSFSEKHKERMGEAEVGIKKIKNSSSKYVGVSYYAKKKRWIAAFHYKKVTYNLGYFKYEVEAALAYNEAALEILGYKARLNDISQEEIEKLWEME
jgi:group I intron endonuclease